MLKTGIKSDYHISLEPIFVYSLLSFPLLLSTFPSDDVNSEKGLGSKSYYIMIKEITPPTTQLAVIKHQRAAQVTL